MSTFVKCGVCGYVLKANRLGEICPVCGRPSRELEPFDDGVGDKRRRILDLRIHPFIAHLPVAFAFTLVILSLLIGLSIGGLKAIVIDTARFLGLSLPVTAMAAFVSGSGDAKLLFATTSTPLLLKKKRIASLFFAIALLVAWMALMSPLETPLMVSIFALLSAASLCCGAILGNLGVPLIAAQSPD